MEMSGGLLKSARMQRQENAADKIEIPNLPRQQPAAPQAPMPMSKPQAPQPAQDMGQNHFADNAMRLLHSDETHEQIAQMVGQGQEGAAEAAVSVADQVWQAFEQQGQAPDIDDFIDAASMIVEDVAQMGVSMGSLPKDPEIGGMPAGVAVTFHKALDKWLERFPDRLPVEQLQAMAQQHESGSDADQVAQQIAGLHGQ